MTLYNYTTLTKEAALKVVCSLCKVGVPEELDLLPTAMQEFLTIEEYFKKGL